MSRVPFASSQTHSYTFWPTQYLLNSGADPHDAATGTKIDAAPLLTHKGIY
jgi:hypothetical protein